MSTKRKRKTRGVSKGGRPRKAGARHPGGRLIQADQKVEPNAVVTLARQTLMGDCRADPSAAEAPMSLAYARGWLTEAEASAGKAFAAAYRSTHPTRRVSPSYEAPSLADADRRSIREMSSAEITAAFDAMMDGTRRQSTDDARQAAACARYNSWSQALTALEHQEIFNAFIREIFPQWLGWQITGRAQTPESLRRRAALFKGLGVINTLLRRKPNIRIDEMRGSAVLA
jgi:hypothetical protein